MGKTEALRSIRLWLAVFMIGLVLSGITAFPLQTELRWLVEMLRLPALAPLARSVHLLPWMERVHRAVRAANEAYPFLAYGTDWLAFAHLVIAIAFIGPWIDPVRNKWVIFFGLIACAGVLPLALIAGPVRGIPLPWRMVDCSFGIFGSIPLLFCLRSLRTLERAGNQLRTALEEVR